MSEESQEVRQLVASAKQGDSEAISTLLSLHEPRLKRMIAARLDARLRARLSESDVMQDVFLTAQQRLDEYDPDVIPLFIWLRGLTGQKLVDQHRFHLLAQCRSAGKEVRAANGPDASSVSLASFFVGQLTSASNAFAREDVRREVQNALDEMDKGDREILSLRHFEQLTNKEVASVLQIKSSSASTRYLRALKRLRQRLEEIPELADYLTSIGS